MEDTLRGQAVSFKGGRMTSLNPCFNGRYSQRKNNESAKQVSNSLNPCFNGRYSQSK